MTHRWCALGLLPEDWGVKSPYSPPFEIDKFFKLVDSGNPIPEWLGSDLQERRKSQSLLATPEEWQAMIDGLSNDFDGPYKPETTREGSCPEGWYLIECGTDPDSFRYDSREPVCNYLLQTSDPPLLPKG